MTTTSAPERAERAAGGPPDGSPDPSGEIVVIGAGPAGLTAALELMRAGKRVTVLESDPEYVGGIARTARYKEFRLDIGGHRFFTKLDEVNAWWDEIMGDDFILVNRQSRIYYNGKFFDYPLRAFNAFWNLGPIATVHCMASHFYRKAFPIKPEVSFRDWVTNRFGDRLFQTFFESYTEKVWGMKCTELSADWAAQRIKGLSLTRAVIDAFTPKSVKIAQAKGEVLETLIDKFQYPRLGCGMLWEKATELLRKGGARVILDRAATGVHIDGATSARVDCVDSKGAKHSYPCSHVISTMPIRDLIRAIAPAAPEHVRSAAEKLRYRDFLTVALVARHSKQFSDNWIYIHDPRVQVGRIQNFRNWSPEMVPDPNVTVLGLEYFCFDGDGTWNSSDEDLIKLGAKELEIIGLAKADDILDGCVHRMPKAYPIYDEHYKAALEVLREWLTTLPNLWTIGRNGMHRYNNQDHSIMMALIAAKNVLKKEKRDPWQVNSENEYLEERGVPKRVAAAAEKI